MIETSLDIKYKEQMVILIPDSVPRCHIGP